MEFDTIVAISTAVGDGAISIVRVSGKDAIGEVSKIFTKDLTKVNSHTIHYGFINDNGIDIDEVLVTVMKSPRSFTTEDVVEISCHGGYAVTNKIFETILKQNVRIAEPGEFTKRAFLNGRIDLVQAEAISDLIKAKTDLSMSVALNSLKKSVSSQVEVLRSFVLSLIANIEVNIDYPEYDDIDQLTSEIIIPKALEIKSKLSSLLNNARDGQIIEKGLVMSIIGSPNVGKSSLLNRLIGENKAIVTDVAGTTRDTVESEIVIGGVLFKLIDTAGIRKTDDIVESIGVEKSLDILTKSDIVLYVLDSSCEVSDEQRILLDQIKSLNHLVLLNKQDLESKIDYDLSEFNTLKISALKDINIEKVDEKIIDILKLNEMNYIDQTVVTKTRHISHLNNALNSINEVISAAEIGIELDLISIDINNIYFELGNVLGYEVSDDILDKLFSEFCLGK
ncbi:MAG: tRNA uridine-5-carboxymethylaminomethyl(34) synthesis GTPase MnmE [Bacilli bacterium]